MYFPTWLLLVIVSLILSMAAFLWGLRSGQFSDQERARYLVFSGESPPSPVKNPSKRTVEVYALMLICAMVAVSFITAVALSIYHSKG